MRDLSFRYIVILLALGSAVFGSACNKPAQAEADAGAAEPLVSVTTASVAEVEVPVTLRLSGTLRGNQQTDLAANANGRVLSTSVERGAQIKPGEVLAKLDVRAASLSAVEARAQAANVQAQQVQAQSECARYEVLKAKGAVSDLEYDKVISQCNMLPLSVEAASARARLAAQNVGDGLVRAPFAGVITERYIDVGQYVRQDTRVVTIVSLDPLRLELAVPESEVGKVKAGAEVTFKVSAFPERTFSGKIRFLSGALRANTRDLLVEALVDNADKSLLPGMFCDAELATGMRKLPSVPSAAVVEHDGLTRAFFVASNRLEERLLSLGPSAGDKRSVLKGASNGEQVVLPPFDKLSNGQRVR